jgi:hypothetical protein
MLRRRSRRPEDGQVLIMAIAFLALFGVITVAVLHLADAVALQIVHTEATASRDSSAEGGAAYAVADATRTVNPLSCTPGAKGTLNMQGGDVVGYTIPPAPNGCYPGLTSSLGGTAHCLLCILNQTPIPPATTASPTTVVLTANKGVTTSGGDDYINGSIGSGTKVTATASPGPASIYVLNGGTSSGCTCSPLPVKSYSTPISDPFGTLGAPSPVAGKPSGCPSWNLTTGCTESLSSGSSTIGPGLWASLAISGNGSVHVTATSGVYVFTGGLTVSGQGTFTATSGVTIYLACPNYGPGGNPCPSSGTVGRTGGYIRFSGQGAVSVSAPGSAQYSSVGGIADVAILADPNLLDPGGVGACVAGTGTCIYNVSGNGASVTGSIDTRSGGVTIGGNGGQTEKNGLLITNSLFIGVSGGATTGLNLSGPGTLTTGSCSVFEFNLNGTTTKNGVATSSTTGFAVVQSACGTGGSANGIVDFNYLP